MTRASHPAKARVTSDKKVVRTKRMDRWYLTPQGVEMLRSWNRGRDK